MSCAPAKPPADAGTISQGPAAPELSENDKIERLIRSFQELSGATFVRNGKAHTTAEAITHLRRKWHWKRSSIKTAEDFIRIAGSQSSRSGRPYLIRMADGTEMKSEQWFRKQLEIMAGPGG